MWTEKDMIGRIREEPKEEKKEEEIEKDTVLTVEEIIEVAKKIAENAPAKEEKDEGNTYVVDVPVKAAVEPIPTSLVIDSAVEDSSEEMIPEEKKEEVPAAEEPLEKDEAVEEVPTIEQNEDVPVQADSEGPAACPFCGAVVKLTYYKRWHITGHETACILAPNFNVGKTKEQILDAWNRRV